MKENVILTIKEILKNDMTIQKADEILIHEPLQNYGVNSVNYIKLIIALEQRYGIEFDDVTLDYDDFCTLEALSDYIIKEATLK